MKMQADAEHQEDDPNFGSFVSNLSVRDEPRSVQADQLPQREDSQRSATIPALRLRTRSKLRSRTRPPMSASDRNCAYSLTEGDEPND